MVLLVKNPPACVGGARDEVLFPESGKSSGGGMATHSSVFAWRIPWTEKLVGFNPLGRKESDTTEAT